MEDNPYFKMISLFRSDNAAHALTYFRFGTVISASPLKIEINDTIQDKSNLKKNEGLEFTAGDNVLLVTLDEDQTFVIVAKVVDV